MHQICNVKIGHLSNKTTKEFIFFARQPCVKMSCVFSGNCMFYIDSMRSETAQTHAVKLTKELIMFQFVGQP